MARPNMIVVAAVVLGPVILGAEGYALYRSHRRPAQEVAATSLLGPPAALPAPPAASLPAPPAILPAPSPIAAPIVEIARQDPPAEPTDANEPEEALRRRQRTLAERRGQIIGEADEQVFDVLNLSDSQRAAIRAIDEAYARSMRALGELPSDVDSPSAGADLNADQTRRAAITDILGAEGMSAFDLAARKAQRRVRNQYRTQWVRGL